MKRLLFIPLVVIMVFSLGACATKEKRVEFKAPNSFTTLKDNSIVYIMRGNVNSTAFYEVVNYAVEHDIPKIVIEIWSPGGLAHETLRIIAIMDEYRDKIIFETRNYSTAWSGGFLVLISGDIGSRFVAKNTSLMWHHVLRVGAADNKKVKPDESTRLYDNIFNNYIVSRSSISIEELLKKIDSEYWYLTSKEAIQYGFVDGYIPRIQIK